MKEFHHEIKIYTDSDWGGEPKTRRSTSGGVLCYEGFVIKTWSKLQSTIALSSVEAEFKAMTKGVQEALALRTMLLEMGIDATIQVFTDSSAAKASAEKPGIGFMWLMNKLQLLVRAAQEWLSQEGGRDRCRDRGGLAGPSRPTRERDVERRHAACVSTSTWLSGPKGSVFTDEAMRAGSFCERTFGHC